jgi:FkbM family methyltransferase
VAALGKAVSLPRRLVRASARRAGRLRHGPDRRAIPRELGREAIFFLAGRVRPTLQVRWPSGRYLVASADYDVSRRTYVAGPYGLDRLLRCAQLIERETGASIRGREVLEVGANIGTTTVPLVTVVGAAYVHAFEPVPRNFVLLERNIELNDLSARVTLHETAVSDHAGTVALASSPRFWGSSRVVADASSDDDVANCVTIDSLLASGAISNERLALVWIDVEGHEAAVLAGATELGPIPIVLEHDPKQQADLEQLHELIHQRNAQLYDLSAGIKVTLAGLGPTPTDLLLLPEP